MFGLSCELFYTEGETVMLLPAHTEQIAQSVSGTECQQRINGARTQPLVPVPDNPDQDLSKQRPQWPLLAESAGDCDDVLSGCDEEEVVVEPFKKVG